MTQLNQPGTYHRHVDYEAGCILHVDPITGEVITQNAMVRAKNSGDPVAFHGGKHLAQKYADRTSADYNLRNYLMAVVFILYVVAKVCGAY